MEAVDMVMEAENVVFKRQAGSGCRLGDVVLCRKLRTSPALAGGDPLTEPAALVQTDGQASCRRFLYMDNLLVRPWSTANETDEAQWKSIRHPLTRKPSVSTSRESIGSVCLPIPSLVFLLGMRNNPLCWLTGISLSVCPTVRDVPADSYASRISTSSIAS